MSLVRAALSQLADSLSFGILGVNRSCWGASTSRATGLPSSISGVRLLRTLAGTGDDQRALPFNSRATVDEPFALPSTLASSTGCPTTPTPHAARLPALAALHPPAGSLLPSLCQQLRGYKSNKRSLKPLNTAASWQAVQPLLAEQRQRAAVEGVSPPVADGARPPPQPGRRRWRPRLGPIVDTCLPPIPAVPLPTECRRVGVITGQYSLEPERTFAVVELAGSQYKVRGGGVGGRGGRRGRGCWPHEGGTYRRTHRPGSGLGWDGGGWDGMGWDGAVMLQSRAGRRGVGWGGPAPAPRGIHSGPPRAALPTPRARAAQTLQPCRHQPSCNPAPPGPRAPVCLCRR